MLPCPIDNCPHQVPVAARPMCNQHWHQIPPAIRVQITLAYSAWRAAGTDTWVKRWTVYAELRQYAVNLLQRTQPETDPTHDRRTEHHPV